MIVIVFVIVINYLIAACSTIGRAIGELCTPRHCHCILWSWTGHILRPTLTHGRILGQGRLAIISVGTIVIDLYLDWIGHAPCNDVVMYLPC